MTISAEIVLDSIGPQSPRLTTFLLRYPKFIHAEHCRHRAMSLCVSSSRAVPVSKNLEEVRSDELRAGPVFWGSEQKGMSGGVEVEGKFDELNGWWNSYCHVEGTTIQQAWKEAAENAADVAEAISRCGVHKSIVNRLLEPFLHVNVLCTVTEPGLLNFFGLRLDKAAQPEIRVLAERMWAAWGESKLQLLQPGEWHLPFVEVEDRDLKLNHIGLTEHGFEPAYSERSIDTLRKVSTARCARLSYTSFETGKRSTIEEDLKLYDRLISSKPIHASPAEHQATPDEVNQEPVQLHWPECFVNPHLHGNLVGWIQHRKILPCEDIAPLPSEYL